MRVRVRVSVRVGDRVRVEVRKNVRVRVGAMPQYRAGRGRVLLSTTYYRLITAHYSLLTTHYSLLTTTHYLLLTGPVGAAHDDEHMCERRVEPRRRADDRPCDLG